MRVDITPTRARVASGQPAVVTATVFNTGDVIAAYRITVLGVDQSWVELDRDEVQLFPDSADSVTAVITLPEGIPAGTRRISVQVTELTPPGDIELVPVEIEIAPESAAQINVEPVSMSGGRTTTFGALVRNQGNTPLTLRLAGNDVEGEVRFEFEPPIIDLEPGAEQSVAGKLRARRPFAGTPRVRTVTVSAAGVDPPPEALATFVQRPLLTRGALSMIGLLLAVTVFAAVITTALGAVIDRSDKDRNLLLEVIQGQRETGEPPGSVTGTVTDLTSAAPISGVTVSAYSVDDLVRPAASGATSDDGRYRLDGLGAGTYKVQFRSAGFVDTWYPSALEPADGDDVEVEAGEITQSIDARLGGVPATIEGTVLGDDPVGAELALQLPGEVEEPGPGGATLATAFADATGAFRFEDVPSPSVYELVVTKEGYARESQLLDLGAGEDRKGVEILLRLGDGVISGTIFSGAGPEGGVEVIATDGTSESRTVSLTQEGAGTYTLRDLPTPATYTVTFAKDGFTTETLQVVLTTAERRTGVDVILEGGAGSISGRVSLSGSGPVGGVEVTVTDGELLVGTTTLSMGEVGTYRVTGLPVPGTYTVTFARPDLQPQTRQVDLDTFGGRDATGIDATLRQATATIFGTVTERTGTGSTRAVGGVTVVLTSGDRTYRVTSSSSPAGRYEIGNVLPGTYTATFSRPGSIPVSQLVTLDAGDHRRLDPSPITQRASIAGTVRFTNNTVAAGVTVRLYHANEYPGGNIATTTTDSQGRYRFADLDAPLSWVVDVSPTPNAAPTGSTTTSTIAGRESTANVVIPL